MCDECNEASGVLYAEAYIPSCGTLMRHSSEQNKYMTSLTLVDVKATRLAASAQPSSHEDDHITG